VTIEEDLACQVQVSRQPAQSMRKIAPSAGRAMKMLHGSRSCACVIRQRVEELVSMLVHEEVLGSTQPLALYYRVYYRGKTCQYNPSPDIYLD
jgi:hypothetical protein